MSGKDFDSFLHNHLTEDILLVMTSTLFILSFVTLEAVLAGRLATYCCAQYSDSRLSAMSQLSRDLEAQFRQGVPRQGLPRQDIGARVAAYLGLQEVLFDRENVFEEAVMLSSCEPGEEEKLLADQDIFIVGKE